MNLKYSCRGKNNGVYNKETAPSPDLVGKTRRTGCGYVLNNLIDELPEDGKQHEIECPKCGNVSEVTKTKPEQE